MNGRRLAFCVSKVSYFVKIETLLHLHQPCALVYFTCAAPFPVHSFVFSLFFYCAPRRICPFSFIVISIAVDGVSIVFGSISISSRLRSIPTGPNIPLKPACTPGNRYSAALPRELLGERKNAATPGAPCESDYRRRETYGRMDESGRADGLTLHECADAGATACVTRPTKSKREPSHSHIASCQSQRRARHTSSSHPGHHVASRRRFRPREPCSESCGGDERRNHLDDRLLSNIIDIALNV